MTQNRRRLTLFCLFPSILAVCFLAIGGAYLLIQKFIPENQRGQVIPPLIDNSTQNISQAVATPTDENMLLIQLSEGKPLPQAAESITVTVGEPLTITAIEQILARLPVLPMDAEDQLAFKLPEQILPPPRTGQTINETFPSPYIAVQPETVEPGPLQVLRYAPEGEIPLAPFINVTFNQPMVPLSTLSDLAARNVPVVVEPELTGTWRWVGTRTLTFQYDSESIDRLPMATEYKVTVPAGTKSSTGGSLAEAVSWTFRTPPVQLTNMYPSSSPQPLNPVFFIAFNQRIDPKSVLDTIRVSAGDKPVDITLASEAEYQNNPQVKNLIQYTAESRWVAFKATKSLPQATTINVVIGPDTPSAEGPLLTTEAQSFSFDTYAPLSIEEHGCSWWEDRCPPLTPFFIQFNNPLDAAIYKETMLRIDPELPNAAVDIVGNTITIRGTTRGQTTYRVTVSADIQDIFGQTLGKDSVLSFRVDSADPYMVGPENALVTLDPSASKPVLSVYVMNYPKLDVRVYAVQPSDWPAYKNYLRDYNRPDNPPSPPGRLVLDKTITVEAPSDSLTEANIDLDDVIEGKFGQFIVIVKPHLGVLQQLDPNRYWHIVQTWVQVTQIGLDAFSDHSQLLVWANKLKDGSPLPGISVETGPMLVKNTTAGDGMTRFDLTTNTVAYLVARQGQDTAILPRSIQMWGEDAWQAWPVRDSLRWYVFDDRQMYRPGEEVHLKGWLRTYGGKQDGDISLVGSTATSVRYQVLDPLGNELTVGNAQVNTLGGFHFNFTIPENANLGYAQVMIFAEGSLSNLDQVDYYHSFQIQEFRRPEFEVVARNESMGPYFAGEHAIVAVSANYYAGGALPNAEVTWQVSASPASYQPPNWPDFSFGTWTPWWWRSGAMLVEESYKTRIDYESPAIQNFAGVTDASGNHYLRLDFAQALLAKPFTVIAEASVMDVNRQAWAAATTLLVHPADLYIGMRSEPTFVERGTPLKIDLIVTDLDGNPVVDRQIKVKAVRLEWKTYQGTWGEEEVDTQECTIGSTEKPVTCSFETPVGGRYQITAQITDEKGRTNQSQITRWVSGGNMPVSRKVEHETVTLIPDHESYQPGDTAKILVQSPFGAAEGLLTVGRSGIVYTERFKIESSTTILQVPIYEKYIPNLNIQVDLVGSAARLDDQGKPLPNDITRPAYASGSLDLSIPPVARTLTLQLDPRQTELEPGGETTLDLTVQDAQGQPVEGAEMAVVIVDEAILALTNYQLADPLAVFYQQRSGDFSSAYLRASIVLADPLALAESARQAEQAGVEKQMLDGMPAPEAMMEAPAMAPMATATAAQPATAQPIRLRSDFNPLAVFSPEVRSDEYGKARVEIKVPDNLTRYRVMVVAVDTTTTLAQLRPTWLLVCRSWCALPLPAF